MYRLIVCDLDGTLLNAEHRLGDYSRAVLEALRGRGIAILLASGRHYLDIRGLAEQLGIHGGLISSNGATVHEDGARLTHCRPIDGDCLPFLLRDPLFDPVHTNLYRLDDWLVETANPILLSYHHESGFAYRVADFDRLDGTPVLKVFYYTERTELLPELEARILARHGDRVTTTHALPQVLEVMARGVSKGEALAGLVTRLGLAPADVIAFGDGRNDLEMLRYAGKGVLMGNADAGLKAALPELEVIGSNARESVAGYLERLFEIT